MLRSVQRGLRASPQTLLPFLRNTRIFSPLLLTPLECLYIKFASDRIFSLRHPLADGGENMRTSPPYPEIGPKFGTIWGLVQKSLRVFFCFFDLSTSLCKYSGRAKFWTRALPPSRDIGKNTTFAVEFGTKCVLWLQLASTFQQISRSSQNTYFTRQF